MAYKNPKRRYRRRRMRAVKRAAYRAFKKRLPQTSTGYLSVKQKEITTLTIPAGPMPTGFIQQIQFALTNMANITEYRRLFDQYRICAVKYTLLPTANTNDQTNQGMTFCSSIDLDGGVAPATFPLLLERSNSKTSPWSTAGGMTPYKKIYLMPRWANQLVADPSTGATATGLGNRKQWLDLANPDVVHHGLNLGWFNGVGTLNQPQTVNVVITYYVQFRKIR